ncbi:MAG TPA: hypothetical protein DD856_13810, partial [Sulfobacillus sp.]|nr:hypothetical protein [Sulfobacillus sp.]
QTQKSFDPALMLIEVAIRQPMPSGIGTRNTARTVLAIRCADLMSDDNSSIIIREKRLHERGKPSKMA